jgi:hypothetical protein
VGMKSDFAKKSSGCDEWYTPKNAIYPILKYLTPNSTIWCPFDTNSSLFVKIFIENGFNVINTHLSYNQDFFTYPLPNCNYIISNPPYSLRNEILLKLFSFSKPFAMLMNTNGIFDSKLRWDLFKNNPFCLIYLSRRINYIQNNNTKSSPPFQSAYITSGLTNKTIIFEEINK